MDSAIGGVIGNETAVTGRIGLVAASQLKSGARHDGRDVGAATDGRTSAVRRVARWSPSTIATRVSGDARA